MINIWIILSIIFLHWISDFVLQSDFMAQNKSKSNLVLTAHVLAYCIPWIIVTGICAVLGGRPDLFLWFIGITFISHWITDYFTSRLNSKLWRQKKVHNFFVSIGFDQVLHYIQLFLTYYYLTK